jgi:FixJ family two-component response regulator
VGNGSTNVAEKSFNVAGDLESATGSGKVAGGFGDAPDITGSPPLPDDEQNRNKSGDRAYSGEHQFSCWSHSGLKAQAAGSQFADDGGGLEFTLMPKVLIIDDESSIRDSIRMILEYEKYKVDEARSGQEGIEKATKQNYDAVLLDIKMPVIDGLEVLDQFRAQKVTSPVVMVSGHGDIHTAVESTKRGAYDFLEKPLNRDRLLLAVRNAIRQRVLEEENHELREITEREYQIVGQSPAVG